MTAPDRDGEALDMARKSLELVARDPGLARLCAARVLAASTHPAARSASLRALALVERERGDLASARDLLDRAIQAARDGNLPQLLAQAQGSQAGLRALHAGADQERGNRTRQRPLEPHNALRNGLRLTHRGQFADASAEFGRALRPLDPAADTQVVVGVLLSRGLALMCAGRLDEAQDDLDRALALADASGLGYLGALVRQNLGCLAVRHGDIAGALADFDAAAPWLAGRRARSLELDRAEAYVNAGMHAEARNLIGECLAGEGSASAEFASARWLAAQVELARGETHAALHHAHKLREVFGPASGWTALAQRIEWTARAATRLTAPAQPPPAHRVPPRRHAYRRVLAAVSLRLAALAALPSRLEARSRAAHTAESLAIGGIGAAATERHARDVLGRIEAVRAARLAVHKNRIPESTLDRYRGIWLQLHTALAERASGVELRRESERLESALRRQLRPSGPPASPVQPAGVDALAAALAHRCFLALTELGSQLLGVTLAAGRVLVHRLGPAARVGDAVRELRAAAHREILGRATPAAVARCAEAVDRLVLRPLAAALGDRPLVIAPVAALHGVPWGRLPRLRGRPVSVATSGTAWLTCRHRVGSPHGRRVLLAAGPDLPGAGMEINELGHAYPEAILLTGTEARTRELRAVLERCDLAHVAGHGVVEPEISMRSGVLLSDGPLTAYDLELTRRLPPLLVLSACGSGHATTRFPGGAPLDFVETALALGTGTVIASVLPVRDRELTPAMVAAHRGLLAGLPPAEAVARHLAAFGFVCFGAD